MIGHSLFFFNLFIDSKRANQGIDEKNNYECYPSCST